MRSIKYRDEEIVIKKATEALIRELGPVEAVRFTNIPKKKRLESVNLIANGRSYWTKTSSSKKCLADKEMVDADIQSLEQMKQCQNVIRKLSNNQNQI